MRMSNLLTKTAKSAPAEADSANAKFLLQGGFVRQEAAGIYSWLPLGLRVLRNVERIIREEMDALGAQEMLMPALHPKEPWVTTGRWDSVDILFKVLSQTKKEYALGASHEEIVTPLVGNFLRSYADLPVAVYQIQTKFRDELRAKSGVLRGREFEMKDMYSFHRTQEDLDAFYQQALETYLTVFQRCGLDAKVVEASGGIFTEKKSHEFQVLTPAGEDVILACSSCTFAQNSEISSLSESDPCPNCGASLSVVKGIETGNIFDLGTKYTEPFNIAFTDENGERQPVLMGCYGIGITRLVGAVVEASHDDRGIIWPKSVAPYAVHLVSLSSKDPDVNERVVTASESLVDDLKAQGIEVLWDDRIGVSAGEKFADADLIGIPLRIVVSEKSLAQGGVEWKLRAGGEARIVDLEAIAEEVSEWGQEA
jgi:prolyl-tRNA synthetase